MLRCQLGDHRGPYALAEVDQFVLGQPSLGGQKTVCRAGVTGQPLFRGTAWIAAIAPVVHEEHTVTGVSHDPTQPGAGSPIASITRSHQNGFLVRTRGRNIPGR